MYPQIHSMFNFTCTVYGMCLLQLSQHDFWFTYKRYNASSFIVSSQSTKNNPLVYLFFCWWTFRLFPILLTIPQRIVLQWTVFHTSLSSCGVILGFTQRLEKQSQNNRVVGYIQLYKILQIAWHNRCRNCHSHGSKYPLFHTLTHTRAFKKTANLLSARWSILISISSAFSSAHACVWADSLVSRVGPTTPSSWLNERPSDPHSCPHSPSPSALPSSNFSCS